MWFQTVYCQTASVFVLIRKGVLRQDRFTPPNKEKRIIRFHTRWQMRTRNMRRKVGRGWNAFDLLVIPNFVLKRPISHQKWVQNPCSRCLYGGALWLNTMRGHRSIQVDQTFCERRYAEAALHQVLCAMYPSTQRCLYAVRRVTKRAGDTKVFPQWSIFQEIPQSSPSLPPSALAWLSTARLVHEALWARRFHAGWTKKHLAFGSPLLSVIRTIQDVGHCRRMPG